ncbi:acetyl/propionyl/methylcrotonyl-CoA carboxylase subunit alpha [Arthrobacter roseus]|uniref:acetyl/propionyl/methylcrotonyl-CoA carboxylase subunit alpha n=1 Tax=Arthrobacter roseus TaxID=136274 RepID=UPI001963F623|nr:acetyl/propionyl/methylcrotonyl-CoA carboxylase subunit alpha [Arthrobacter roseus]MBM7848195.1 acetyl-CoA/propionyl-CoA carboxylase biotin carboxyl carrier protein [Arthrobacter roseus]
MKLFDTVLVANRGEIACRVIRTLRDLGIRSVAVYSDADAGARHVQEADLAVHIGPASAAESYLSIAAIVDACRVSGASAVHPGYGFLSENVEFARALDKEGITFIGPGVHALNVMGDKIRSKNHVMDHGVPVVPGIAKPGLTDEQLLAEAPGIGYPLLIKPSAGGGGKGMHVVEKQEDLADTLPTARRIAASAFGDDTLFMERLVLTPRHIEVQVLADNHGNVVHLGERECSLQRRHQKVVEEAPSSLLDPETRARIGKAACDAARSVDYTGAGTVEFLVADSAPDEFFFMEMNTRLQVEHPVTEMVTGVDLVAWQIRIAAGEELSLRQEDIELHGHAVEARVYAEDPENSFLPSTGTVLRLEEPSGEGVRVDSSLLAGVEISSNYDPMISKVIAWGKDREQALDRLDRALAETMVLGVKTNTEYLRLLINDDDVRAGRLDTTMIERKMPDFEFRRLVGSELAVIAVESLHQRDADLERDSVHNGSPWSRRDGWRVGARRGRRVPLEVEQGEVQTFEVEISDVGYRVRAPDGVLTMVQQEAGALFTTVDGLRRSLNVASSGRTVWYFDDGWTVPIHSPNRQGLLQSELAAILRAEGAVDPDVRSSMPGTVVSVSVADGDTVEAGQTLVTVEAMKMEHQLTAPLAGTVAVSLKPGDLVKARQVVATITADETVPDSGALVGSVTE